MLRVFNNNNNSHNVREVRSAPSLVLLHIRYVKINLEIINHFQIKSIVSLMNLSAVKKFSYDSKEI